MTWSITTKPRSRLAIARGSSSQHPAWLEQILPTRIRWHSRSGFPAATRRNVPTDTINRMMKLHCMVCFRAQAQLMSRPTRLLVWDVTVRMRNRCQAVSLVLLIMTEPLHLSIIPCHPQALPPCTTKRLQDVHNIIHPRQMKSKR